MYLDAVKVAVKEDSIAYWQKLNRGANYHHIDFAVGDPAPERKKKKRRRRF